MCHVSPVPCNLFLLIFTTKFIKQKNIYNLSEKKFTKWWSYSVEGLLSTGPTPSSSQLTPGQVKLLPAEMALNLAALLISVESVE